MDVGFTFQRSHFNYKLQNSMPVAPVHEQRTHVDRSSAFIYMQAMAKVHDAEYRHIRVSMALSGMVLLLVDPSHWSNRFYRALERLGLHSSAFATRPTSSPASMLRHCEAGRIQNSIRHGKVCTSHYNK